jgi:hypothetical protein
VSRLRHGSAAETDRAKPEVYMTNKIIAQYKGVWGNDPSSLLRKYGYQPRLTPTLDGRGVNDWTREAFYEIVLWKINRWPEIDDKLLSGLPRLGNIKPRQHRKAEDVLRALLSTPGIALPMTSTILRFLKPQTFQIIDDRVYRIVRPGAEKYPNKPGKINESYLKNSVRIYFGYLDELRRLCSKKLPFQLADRILYQLDVELGHRIGE